MIEKLKDYYENSHYYNNECEFKEEIINKINEIIDTLNEDECTQGCRTELPSLKQEENIKENCFSCNWFKDHPTCARCKDFSLFEPIQKPKVENINIDDMYIAEKKVDKLEEARKFEMKYAEKMYYYTVDVMHKIELYEQAIEQIIKEKDKYKWQFELYQNDNCKMVTEINKLKKQLKQKKPDKEIINKIFDEAYHWINYVGRANYRERINEALIKMQQLEKELEKN